MKSIRNTIAVLLAGIMSIPQIVSAGQELPADQGSWQVIGNKYQKRILIVQFYNHKKELIYEERLEGVKLNLRKRETIILLNELVLKAIAFRSGNKVLSDTNLVLWALKNQRKKVTS